MSLEVGIENRDVANRWVVGHLLKVELRVVVQECGEGFSKHGVQGLLPDDTVVEETSEDENDVCHLVLGGRVGVVLE